MAVASELAMDGAEPSDFSKEGRNRLHEILVCALSLDGAAVAAMTSALSDETVGTILERWFTRSSDTLELLHFALQEAGFRDVEVSRSIMYRFGLVVVELPDDDFECDYWAEKFDELADWDSNNFNTLHRYSTDVSKVPFPWRSTVEALRPILLRDFSLTPEEIYLSAAFFIRYGLGRNRDLRRHTDDSYLTLNICLRTDSIEGCSVRFFGPRYLSNKLESDGQGPDCPSMNVLVDVPAGSVLLHWGSHEHETLPWRCGDRWSLILWFKQT